MFDLESGAIRSVLEVDARHDRIAAFYFEHFDHRLTAIRAKQVSFLRGPSAGDASPGRDAEVEWIHDGRPHSPAVADRRLKLVVDILDNEKGTESLTWRDFGIRSGSPRAAFTRDMRLTVFDDGNGVFSVFRTGSRALLAKFQQGSLGPVVVLAGLARPDTIVPSDVPERVERLARILVPDRCPSELSRGAIVRTTIGGFAELSADGRLVAFWREPDKRVDVVDLGSGQTIAAQQVGGTTNASAMMFLKDGRSIATGFRDQTVRVWNSEIPRGSLVMTGHAPKEAWALAFAPDGRTLASGGDDHKIRLWDTATGELRATLVGHESLVTALDYSSDGKSLFSGSFERGKELVAWDVATARPKQVFTGHAGRVRAISLLCHDRVLISGCDDSKLRMWDFASGRRLRTVVDTGGRVFGVAVSPDGRTAATVREDPRVVMTDVATGVSRSIPATDPPTAVTFSADGSRFYFAERTGQIAIWDVARNECIGRFAGHDSLMFSLAVSPDGTTLASASADKTVRLWDTATHNELLHFTDFKARVNKVIFSRDGTMLAAADHDGLVTLWSTRSKSGVSPSQTGKMPSIPIVASDGQP